MRYYNLNDKWVCKECDRVFDTRQATTSHIYRAHVIPGQSTGGGHVIGVPAWNKGLTKDTDARVKKYSDSQKGKIGTFKGKTHSENAKRKISQFQSINNTGGKCKWFKVAGQNVQGTWERDIALKFEELGIEWKKLKTLQHTFDYVMDDKIRCYTPDFYLPEYDLYLEVKGRRWGRDREKMDIVIKTYPNTNIVIIEKQEYEKIMRGELVWSFQRLPEEQ